RRAPRSGAAHRRRPRSPAGACHLRRRAFAHPILGVEMSEQSTPELPGGWLPPATPDAPFGEPRRPGWRRAGGSVLAALAVIGAKLKAILVLLPKLKVLTTSGSMLVSI